MDLTKIVFKLIITIQPIIRGQYRQQVVMAPHWVAWTKHWERHGKTLNIKYWQCQIEALKLCSKEESPDVA